MREDELLAAYGAIKPRKAPEDEAGRFWAKTAPTPSGCLQWRGQVDGAGRPIWTRADGVRVRAARHAFELTHGVPPDGMTVRRGRDCGRKWCINPAHMDLVATPEHLRELAGRQKLASGNPPVVNKLSTVNPQETEPAKHE